MARAKLNLKGFEEYLERLAKLNEDIDAIADEALVAGGQVIVDEMLALAPVGETGNLKQHIKMTPPEGDGSRRWIKVGIYDVNRETEMYFFYQEMGTSSMVAHPYIRPAFDTRMNAARAAMLKVFKARGAL